MNIQLFINFGLKVQIIFNHRKNEVINNNNLNTKIEFYLFLLLLKLCSLHEHGVMDSLIARKIRVSFSDH